MSEQLSENQTASEQSSDVKPIVVRCAVKIVGKSNFDDDMVEDLLIADNVLEQYAQMIIDHLNDKIATEYGRYYYHVVPLDYELHHFVP